MQHRRDRHQKNGGWPTRSHDELLERLTGGMGTVEFTSYDELQLLDTGVWMGERFTGMHIPRFEDIRILAWQGDHESLPLLRKLQESGPQNKVLIAWAIEKIEVLRFQPWTN